MATARWASGCAEIQIRDTDITAFDLEVARLKLQPRDLISSIALRYWAKRWKNRRYIPEYLLVAWGMSVQVEYKM